MTALTPDTTSVDLTTANFQQCVVEESYRRPVVVDFWAEWCAPCRTLGPVLEKLAAEGEGDWLLAKIDTEANQDLAAQFQIRGIPAVKAFVQGKQVNEFVGVLPEPQLREWLRSFVPSKQDKQVLRARSMEPSEREAAVSLLENVLAEKPRHALALLTSAQWAAERGDHAAAANFLERIEFLERDRYAQEIAQLQLGLQNAGDSDLEKAKAEFELDPDDMNARLSYAAALAARQDYEAAMSHCLAVVKAGEPSHRELARERLVALFEAAGFHSELTRTYRALLSKNLYI